MANIIEEREGAKTRDAFVSPRRVRTHIDGETRTEQQHKEAVDIQTIMGKVRRGLMVDHIRHTEGFYRDIHEFPDFKEAMDTIARAKSNFHTVPAKLRERFHNSPGEWIDFIENPENRSEMLDLGLPVDHLPEPEAEPQPVQVEVVNPEPPPGE